MKPVGPYFQSWAYHFCSWWKYSKFFLASLWLQWYPVRKSYWSLAIQFFYPWDWRKPFIKTGMNAKSCYPKSWAPDSQNKETVPVPGPVLPAGSLLIHFVNKPSPCHSPFCSSRWFSMRGDRSFVQLPPQVFDCWESDFGKHHHQRPGSCYPSAEAEKPRERRCL